MDQAQHKELRLHSPALKAMPPPPEERGQVKSAIGVVRAGQSRKS